MTEVVDAIMMMEIWRKRNVWFNVA